MVNEIYTNTVPGYSLQFHIKKDQPHIIIQKVINREGRAFYVLDNRGTTDGVALFFRDLTIAELRQITESIIDKYIKS